MEILNLDFNLSYRVEFCCTVGQTNTDAIFDLTLIEIFLFQASGITLVQEMVFFVGLSSTRVFQIFFLLKLFSLRVGFEN